ncbi:Fibronectin type III, partial [Trinorchestia longiramus]
MCLGNVLICLGNVLMCLGNVLMCLGNVLLCLGNVVMLSELGLQGSVVLEEATGVSVANVSSTSPNIVVENLAPGQDYLVEVRAMNAKGESQPFLLQGFALKVAENKIHAPDPNDSSSHLLPVFVGAVAGVVVMVLLLLLLARLRQRGRRRQAAANSALTTIKKDNSSGFSTGSSSGLEAMRPLREVTHRGTITDDLTQVSAVAISPSSLLPRTKRRIDFPKIVLILVYTGRLAGKQALTPSLTPYLLTPSLLTTLYLLTPSLLLTHSLLTTPYSLTTHYSLLT